MCKLSLSSVAARHAVPGALEYIKRALRILESTYGVDNQSTKIAAQNLEALQKRLASS